MSNKFEKIEEFKSENKNVALIDYNDDKAILKLFPSEEAMQKEAKLMQKISNTGYAPKVYKAESNYLICEHIEGKNFHDAYVLATMLEDKKELANLAQKIAIFMQMFHSVTDDIILGTIDFNNFVIKDDRCVGISFVGAKDGMPYQDVAEIVAYAITNTVGDLYSCVPFILMILKCFHLTIMDIINDISDAIDKYDKKHLIDKRAVLDACLNFDENDIAWDILNKE